MYTSFEVDSDTVSQVYEGSTDKLEKDKDE